ncbi:MAG TPA: hypothetical protein VEM15_07185 [Thermodesulfobacteriota bacterium]|nr:hypothetical protein [Thermodesulfobacteriota bacterium]
MRRIALIAVLVISLVTPSLACAHVGRTDVVDVQIVSDNGEAFPKYETFLRGHRQGEYYYLEAVKGQRYSIQVTNKSDRRIGLVIAVDGRNIIDGKKSDLRRNERMYIIGPYGINTFEGWRTSMDRTNRFYFTEQPDSYAEKVFADASAMGTIALAVYKEKISQVMPHADMSPPRKEAPAAGAPSAVLESRAAGKYKLEEREQAGTGFGETTYSPSNVVQFDPEHTIAAKIVLKYEWRSELCRKGIISCGPKNRLWPDDLEFSPIPGDFKG